MSIDEVWQIAYLLKQSFKKQLDSVKNEQVRSQIGHLIDQLHDDTELDSIDDITSHIVYAFTSRQAKD